MGRSPGAEHEVKRKPTPGALTLCEVCDIQLNSSAQAQIHYNGKTHQRRLRQANRAKSISGARISMGSQGAALLTSLPVQPQLDLKHFLPPRVNSLSPFSLFSNMDPVQKAVISHTFSIAQSLKKKQIITCNICHLRFNSTNQAEAHYKGHKHARKLKAIDKLKDKQRILGKSSCRETEQVEGSQGRDGSVSEKTEPSPASNPGSDRVQGISVTLTPASNRLCESKRIPECPAPVPPAEQTSPWISEEGSRTRRKCSLQCAVCKVTVNSGSQLEDHYKGSRHRLMLRSRCTPPWKRARGADLSRATPRPKRRSVIPAPADQSHHCSLCDVNLNSEAQLQQHLSSRRHRERATGNQHSAKFRPYINNSVHSGSTMKLSLRKELFRTLTSSFRTSALTPASALCAMATGPVSLSHVHPQTALVHAPLLSPTLFRPALGPLSTPRGPIFFSPF